MSTAVMVLAVVHSVNAQDCVQWAQGTRNAGHWVKPIPGQQDLYSEDGPCPSGSTVVDCLCYARDGGDLCVFTADTYCSEVTSGKMTAISEGVCESTVQSEGYGYATGGVTCDDGARTDACSATQSQSPPCLTVGAFLLRRLADSDPPNKTSGSTLSNSPETWFAAVILMALSL